MRSKRKIYDTVFTSLFSDPENQLRLYRDLHPEDTDAGIEDIKDVTLKATMLDQIYNDLGFTVRDISIILLEAQSTWSENIALRSLIYIAETYKNFLAKTKQSYYRESPVRLPKPELYVLYTGDAPHSESEIVLSNVHWGGKCDTIDLKVKVLYGEDNGSILSEYAEFCRKYRSNARVFGPNQHAVLTTIDDCISRNVLKEFLERQRPEVIDIMMALFDDDLNLELFLQDKEREVREVSLAEGRAEGIAEGRIEAIRLMLKTIPSDDIIKMGFSADEIAEALKTE